MKVPLISDNPATTLAPLSFPSSPLPRFPPPLQKRLCLLAIDHVYQNGHADRQVGPAFRFLERTEECGWWRVCEASPFGVVVECVEHVETRSVHVLPLLERLLENLNAPENIGATREHQAVLVGR